MFLKKIINKFRKKNHETIAPRPEEKAIRDIDIELTYIGNFLKFDIKEDCNIYEYVKAFEKNNCKLEDSKIANSALFDKGLEHIKSKTIYIFNNNNIEYNIYSNDQKLYINERVIELESNHIDEIILEVERKTGIYTITNLKHNEVKSTYFVKFFKSNDPDYQFFQLGKENALNIAQQVLENLNKISGIESIIDLDIFYEAMGITKKDSRSQVIQPIKFIEDKTEKVKSKKV